MGSSSWEQEWRPGWSQASCYLGHPAPSIHGEVGDKSGCGFHALARIESLHPVTPTSISDYRGQGCGCLIVGLAGLAGDIIEGTRNGRVIGWRGQEGRVLALLDTPPGSPYGPLRNYCDCCNPKPACTVNHLPRAADRLDVPIFQNPHQLQDYADKLRGRPRTWPVHELRPPQPEPEPPDPSEALAALWNSIAAAIPGARLFLNSQTLSGRIKQAAMDLSAARVPDPTRPPATKRRVPQRQPWWGNGPPPPWAGRQPGR
jgi:hypothetical protein